MSCFDRGEGEVEGLCKLDRGVVVVQPKRARLIAIFLVQALLSTNKYCS